MTHRQRVLELLRRNEWVCGSKFLEEMMPRYSARLHELRQQGYLIDSRQCANPKHRHGAGQMDEWHLASEPDRWGNLRLPA